MRTPVSRLCEPGNTHRTDLQFALDPGLAISLDIGGSSQYLVRKYKRNCTDRRPPVGGNPR